MRALMILALLVSACGPDFSGAFSGSLTEIGSCSDGSGVNSGPRGAQWAVSDSGETISVSSGGSCFPLSADTGGNVAQVRARACGSITSGTTTISESITGGTLTLDGRSLFVSISSSVQFSGGTTGSCSTTTSGTLQKN